MGEIKLTVNAAGTAQSGGGGSGFSGAYADLTGKPVLFSGVYSDLSGKPALFDGVYASLSGKPTLGTAAATDAVAYASAAQGAKADSALQPAGSGASLTGLTKEQVGLSNVDNTSDASKPVSTATQTALDGKQVAGSYASGTGSANGTNTGDNATNTQYSGLAASKQETLVSGTNIKTINGSSVLGSGNLVVGGGASINALRTTADQTINAGAGVFTDITGLTFPVVSGTDYAFEFYITFRSAATTTGWRAGVNCPAGTLDFWAGSDVIANGAAGVATHTERHNTVRDDMTLLTATITQAVDLNVRIKGRYLCTANGTFAARFANELAANVQIVVQKGSWGTWF